MSGTLPTEAELHEQALRKTHEAIALALSAIHDLGQLAGVFCSLDEIALATRTGKTGELMAAAITILQVSADQLAGLPLS